MTELEHTKFFIDGKRYEVSPANLLCSYKEYPYNDIRPEEKMKWMEEARKQQIKIYFISENVFIKTTLDLKESDSPWGEDLETMFNPGNPRTEIIDRETAVKLINLHGENVVEENYHLVFPSYREETTEE